MKNLASFILFTVLLFPNMAFGEPQIIDLNGNGLDDIWELYYNATGLSGEVDTDGDRATNYQECAAGTNPFDPISVIAIADFSRGPESVDLRWPSEMGKLYEIEFSSDLVTWSNSNIVAGGTGSDLELSMGTVPAGTQQRLLRQQWSVSDSNRWSQIADLGNLTGNIAQKTEYADEFRIDFEDGGEDLYLSVTRAILTPQVSGTYRFKITGDDQTQLFLSADSTAENRVLIASSPWAIPFDIFTWDATQISEDVELVAGEPYYIEVQLFERDGGDGVQVVWEGPGIVQQDIPATVLSPFEVLPGPDASYFRVRVEDADADGDELSDWVELKYGFSTQTQTSFNGVQDYTALANELAAGSASVFVAYVRPTDPLHAASGAGVASLRFTSSNEAEVSLAFNHLTAETYTTSLAMDSAGSGASIFVFDTPDSEFTHIPWTLGGNAAAVRTALQEGRLYLRVQTASGEWRGYFNDVGSSMFFMAPVDPPAVPSNVLSRTDAIRFLNQATFGADEASIVRVQALGYEGWIDEQLSLPASLHQPYTEALRDALADPDSFWTNYRQDAWWHNALRGEDQLRMRMAFALSQVIPVNESATNFSAVDSDYFYDIFVRHAFGDYPALLREVTLSPIMGQWLTYLANAKANPVTGQRPDENYAREIMQLFTIGLLKLHPDGTLKLGRDGMPQQTYNQTTISEMARVFTGWSWSDLDGDGSFYYQPDMSFQLPMDPYPFYHDFGSKKIVNGVILPANQSPEKDIDDALLVLTNHDNIGPFVSRLLIKRFTTSNPSPEYIYRVASVWKDTGGDLGAVIKAILLDFEARSQDLVTLPGVGKITEPIIRWTRVFRALGVNPQPNASSQPDPQRFPFYWNVDSLGQQSLGSPTVFNFYQPDFTPARIEGSANVNESGLTAPEFQILTETVAVSSLNHILSMVLWGFNSYDPDLEVGVDFELDNQHPLLTLAVPGNTAALVDHLDEVLTGSLLLTETRDRIISALDHQNLWGDPENRLRSAIYLIVSTPEHASQP